MWCRLQCPRTRVNARVISFGNITAGGTGKTPAVIERARQEVASGRKVAVLTRGYGSQSKESLIVANESSEDLYLRIGDEPALIARKVPRAIVIKCADRVLAAKTAIDEHGCDTLIMDDGFQHVRLERDENIVLIDAANPFGNGHLLPRGILREPLHALKRATHFILTRCQAPGTSWNSTSGRPTPANSGGANRIWTSPFRRTPYLESVSTTEMESCGPASAERSRPGWHAEKRTAVLARSAFERRERDSTSITREFTVFLRSTPIAQ